MQTVLVLLHKQKQCARALVCVWLALKNAGKMHDNVAISRDVTAEVYILNLYYESRTWKCAHSEIYFKARAELHHAHLCRNKMAQVHTRRY